MPFSRDQDCNIAPLAKATAFVTAGFFADWRRASPALRFTPLSLPHCFPLMPKMQSFTLCQPAMWRPYWSPRQSFNVLVTMGPDGWGDAIGIQGFDHVAANGSFLIV